MKNNLFWLLGSDDNHGWHQRIMLASSVEAAQQWWTSILGRPAEVALGFEMIEQSVKTLDQVLPDQTQEGLFAAWVMHDDVVSFVPVLAYNDDDARRQAQELIPHGIVQAIVTPAPLADVYARMCAIDAGQMEADEDIR